LKVATEATAPAAGDLDTSILLVGLGPNALFDLRGSGLYVICFASIL